MSLISESRYKSVQVSHKINCITRRAMYGLRLLKNVCPRLSRRSPRKGKTWDPLNVAGGKKQTVFSLNTIVAGHIWRNVRVNTFLNLYSGRLLKCKSEYVSQLAQWERISAQFPERICLCPRWHCLKYNPQTERRELQNSNEKFKSLSPIFDSLGAFRYLDHNQFLLCLSPCKLPH